MSAIYSFCTIWIELLFAFRHASSGEEFQWWYVSKRLTFSAAMRAALGDVLSKKDMDDLFPLACVMGQGVFAPVRTR